MAQGIGRLYTLRNQFIVIGLTGRTGSGCTTAAKVLSRNIEELNLRSPANPIENNDERKHAIIYDWVANHWKKFNRISISDIIISKIVSTQPENLEKFLIGCEMDSNTVERIKESCAHNVEAVSTISRFWCVDDVNEHSSADRKKIRECFFENIQDIREVFKKLFEGQDKTKYTHVLQVAGDNLRRSGTIDNIGCNPDQLFFLADAVNRLIKICRQVNKEDGSCDYFVIDAIRHPFEAAFFRSRYSAFYLIGITTTEESRRKRLYDRYNDEQIDEISNKEYPGKDLLENYDFLVSQNIGACLQQADILINNVDDEPEKRQTELSANLAKYVALMQHPGLVSPSPVERSMQIAITAKINSGCASRQVGAVVTGPDFSIKSVGWNSCPQGQVPCTLRNIGRLRDGTDKEAFSKYERNEFRDRIQESKQYLLGANACDGRPLIYCFKSTYNKYNTKKQVQPRSLHAEENAFLQIVKYGGMGVLNGYLFTTSSPCELCSKKAYQLGIKRIYYIEPYPGVATDHVIDCGTAKPELVLFTGAIGRAHIQLYDPFLSQKDELEILLMENASNVV